MSAKAYEVTLKITTEATNTPADWDWDVIARERLGALMEIEVIDQKEIEDE